MNEAFWMDETMKQAGECLLTLMKAALTNEKTELQTIPDWYAVHFLANFNSLTGLAYYGLQKLNVSLPEDLQKHWKKEVMMIAARQIQLDRDREILSREMGKKGLDYLYIKGIEIQNLYPQYGMRQMSDNDILYRDPQDEERGLKSISQKKMRELMKELNAKEVSHDGTVDVFIMGKTSLFEMHRDFLGPDQKHYGYFHDIWQKAKIDTTSDTEEKSHHYRLSWEDQYILMIAHSHKHYSGGGCGPREIADAWQFRQAKQNEMNWDYIRQELKKINLIEYEVLLTKLGQIIFEETNATQEERKILENFIFSGTYGSQINRIQNELKGMEGKNKSLTVQQAKRRYLWKRLFPEPEYLQSHFPFFYRHRSLIGFLLIYRGGRALFTKSGKIRKELLELKKAEIY